MACNENNFTVTFSEEVKGWTSFHSYKPDFMKGMNNKFYSFKDGNIHLHHSDNVNRNVLYGATYPTQVSVIVNENPSMIKELKAISLEGNTPWDITTQSFVTGSDDYIQSTVDDTEFVVMEGLLYAHTRRNENPAQLDSLSAYGIGEITTIDTLTLTINGFSSSLTTGDTIKRGSDLAIIGVVESSSVVDNVTTIIFATTDVTPDVGDFVFGIKDARTEGGSLRGYVHKLSLEVTSPNKVELYAVNSKMNKSYS